jgi:predicted nucleic acid-binding protein
LRGEDGADLVQRALESASRRDTHLLMTEVSYAEVKYITIRKDGREAWERVAASLDSLPILFLPATRALADAAADLKASHRISLADAFAVALAKQHQAELITGDPEFRALEKQLTIRWLTNG